MATGRFIGLVLGMLLLPSVGGAEPQSTREAMGRAQLEAQIKNSVDLLNRIERPERERDAADRLEEQQVRSGSKKRSFTTQQATEPAQAK